MPQCQMSKYLRTFVRSLSPINPVSYNNSSRGKRQIKRVRLIRPNSLSSEMIQSNSCLKIPLQCIFTVSGLVLRYPHSNHQKSRSTRRKSGSQSKGPRKNEANHEAESSFNSQSQTLNTLISLNQSLRSRRNTSSIRESLKEK